MEILATLSEIGIETSVLIIFNLILIESLLSVDNAAVLATMVRDLPEHQQGKALRYGILGAYFFRGLSLVFVAVLIKISFLKLLGGVYLLWLTVDYFYTKTTPATEDDLLVRRENFLYSATLGRLGKFWATVVLVEFMDLSFSIDNVFAAVALVEQVPSPYNFYLVCTGVFIGILAMRFAAQGFVLLMNKFNFLEALAFVVIGILGMKLVASYACEFFHNTRFCEIMNGHHADLIISIVTTSVFVVPVLTSIAFNFPKRAKQPAQKINS
ncbi:MAG TPA: hypothetical protein VNJ07_05850 [Chitinophagales bacterium]|nr:hypothetical protein [Chitinophagales bacterium]